MGGTNPYIEKTDYQLPTSSYTVTYVSPDGKNTYFSLEPVFIPY
jgi:2Fe-2S ferredoxin